jgi:hypothetical protein
MPTKTITAGGIPIVYDPAEEDTAGMIRGVCEQTLRLVREGWGLPPPKDCRIYVMTSYFRWMFQAAPWPWRVFLGMTIPLWISRTRRVWPVSAGWTLRFGKKTAIGVKPPRLTAQSDRSIGSKVFVEEKDPAVKLRTTACHELVHACAAHLILPVDRLVGRPTVRRETLPLVRDFSPKKAPPGYREVQSKLGQTTVYHAARGYWLVRYLEEQRPGFLKGIFSRRRNAKAIEAAVAAELRMEPRRFWADIDGVLYDHFEPKGSRP